MSDSHDNNKSEFTFDASTAKPVDTASDVKTDGFTFDPSTAKEDKKGIKGHAQDVGASLMGGLAAVPDTLVGLADMYTEGRAGKAIDDNLSDFYKLGNAQKYWQDQKTDVAKQQQQQFHDAEGIVDKTKIALQNPSMIANAAVESLPSMFLGGALGKATKIANPIAAAAVGEGAVMAGAQAEQIRQNSDDQMLNNGQEAASALTGGLGALFGFAGGRIAQKLGIGDIDSMIVSGRIGPTQIAGEIANTSSKSLPRRVIEGAISEGFLEELPQSISEQIIQNLATDKHWSDGVDDAAVMGTLAGMAMGGVANIPSGHSNNAQGDNNNLQTESNPTSPLPQLSGPSMEGEYIPRGAREQNSANFNQSNYEYTQFDSDASNLLGNNSFDSTDTGNGPTDPVQPDIGGGSYFDSQKPSERLGLNPDNGPMSSAAALAVDSGAFTSATSMGDAASATSRTEQVNAGTNFSDNTAQAIQYGMGEIAQGAKEAALENTIQRLEKDGEVQLFKQDSIAKALEDQNYNVRLNKDGSASIIGVKNPSTNEWHGTERTDSSTPALNMADTQDQSSDSNKSQELATLQQRFDEAKTAPEKAKIRKEITQLQNNQLQPGVNSNDKLQSTDEPEIRNSEVPDSTGTQFTTASATPTNDVENVPNEKESKSSPVANDVTDQINQLEQKFSAAKSVPQKAKIRNQINQLKSQQIESSEKPQNTVLNPEQIKTQYGDAPESVMSDIEILGDDFTVDLREDNKKANALNNPNYNAVQKADGSVEIVGMKHPTTGEWVGKKPTAVSIDEKAHQAATSAENNTPEPTQAQIEAGNYKKGHIKVQGLDISIENPKGSERRGTDPNGKEWAHTMSDHYGYIKRTVGADSEQIDTYIGKNPESDQVFIVDQIDQETGNFDEHKVMLGFDSQDNATKAYQSNFDKGWKVGQIRSMTVEQFKDWLKNGDTTKPAKNDSKGINVDKDEQKSSTKNQDNTESQDTDSTEQTDLISKMEAKLTRLETEIDNIFNDMPFMGHGGTPFVDNSKGRQMKRNHDKRDERLQAKKKEIEEQKEKIDNMKDRIAQRSQPTKKSQKFLEGNPIHQGLFELEKLGLVKQWKKNPQYFFVNGLDKVALATWDGEISLAKRFPVNNKEELDKAKALIVQANELIKNNTKDFSRKTPLKPDEERKGTSPIETTFNALSVVSGTRRVLSVLQHLKLSATQDPSISGRITVGSAGIKGGFDVQVISSFNGLPAEIQKDATYKDDKGNTQNYDVSAVWHDGTLYVVADQVYGDSTKQLTTFDAYEEMLAHEIIGHFGIQQIFGQEYKTKLQQLYNALGKLDGIRKIASNNSVDMAQFESAYIEPYTQGAKDGIYAESDVQQALVGELFAFVAQNAKSRPFVRQKLKEVIGYIRQWFRERGFDKFLSRYNDADLMMFLSEARKAVVDRSYFGKYKNQNISAKNDSDTPLYSRSRENKAGSTINQVRDLLIERFGKDTINELERQGKLEIIQDYQVEGVEGFYYNGKAVLVASNLTNESAIPTFLHELGGHAGFQNMMNQEQYNELMRQFDKLVEQGNPVAMAAKLLAEREQGNVRQQLEYLPYLLTLSSTMQQRNVIQRNALNKLIQNIVTYVKAWVFDNFGINLNLNPDDILALSERMVKQIERQSSLDTVRQKYHGTSQWMTAPNGAKTHLSEQQWLQVRTPEFKKWFGDWENDAKNASQVLDENGEPKVVYHGTATEFNEFRKGHGLLGDGIYLTDSFDTAGMYANNRGKNGFVLPLFVNIRNALKTTGNVSRDKVVEATNSGKYQGIVHQFEDQELIVALESNQVKIAEGNTGTFNSESADIRFSRSAKDIIDRLSKNLGDLSVKSVKEKTGYKFTDWLGLGLSTLGRRQLTEIYSKILPQLNKYNDLAAQMDADKNDAGAEADSIVREWANLKDENQLADLMHDATLAKIDPAKPYVKGDSIIKYKQLRDDFNALTPEAQSMYIKARDAYKKHYAKVQFAIKERILRAALSSQKKADLIKQMDDQFYGYVKGVYFPLSRFGKYVVVTRNNLGQVESVSRAETMAEAQALRSELMQKYPHFKVDRVILDKEFSASRDAAGRGFMSNLFDEVANLGLSASEMVEFEDTLNQLYLSSMPDLSWAKHGIHRKGTAGFSQDARRAFAQNMFHGAGYLAKLRYGDQMAEQLDAMQKYSTEQTKTNSNYDQPVAQRVIDEMNKRHEILMNPKSHPLSSTLTSFGFIYYLGLSPAAAIVNLSQTALVAYPIMGAKWGFDKAATELLRASNDFRKGVDFHKVKWEGTKTDLYKTVSSDISKFLNKDEKQAYDDAVARGVIDVTQAHDLAGIAQGEDSGIMWKTRPIMRAASVMFHSAERFNREVTFIAAYRLARQSGSKHDLAFDQAVDATYKGHFDYSSGNRPRIMQGNVAKVLLLFKQFGQNMIYTLVRQTYQSIKGETDAERKEARKSLGAILAMHATFAGVLGLPMVGMLLSLASWAGGDDDDPWDAEVALRNYLAEAFGPTISNLLMKGAPRALTPADVSSRVGINNLLLPDVQEGLEGKRWAESAMAGALGPVAGIGLNVAKGTQEISEGHNLRGLETMLPVFLKNFAKTYRYGDEGVQDKTGVSIMDEVSSMDLLVQGMGFSPSDVRTANEGKSAIYQLDKKLNERRGRLMALWSRAKMIDDQQEMDEIWEEIQGFNDKNPSRRITRVNLNQSYKNRQRRIDRSEDGIYLSRNRQEARSAGYFAFGE
ncbi:PLxRFG domain-containing protein [Acinetobacter guillouiae]|uniref:PLxRFG domain-containing protein n=1 Tax=Acinetobacter guillouiae TaxID=106649 RepID=UPI001F1D9823|nr:PLxRFG domain-containing protein [Acinetobacter guillouiae]